MYAVFLSGGKQYRVQAGQAVKLEKLEGEPGSTLEFDKILMMGDTDQVQVGAPYLEGQKIAAEILSQGRGKKIRIIKIKRRKHHRKHLGHRQYFTEVKITSIGA